MTKADSNSQGSSAEENFDADAYARHFPPGHAGMAIRLRLGGPGLRLEAGAADFWPVAHKNAEDLWLDSDDAGHTFAIGGKRYSNGPAVALVRTERSLEGGFHLRREAPKRLECLRWTFSFPRAWRGRERAYCLRSAVEHSRETRAPNLTVRSHFTGAANDLRPAWRTCP